MTTRFQEKQQKRAAEAKNSGPAQTALEATRRMLTKKVPHQTETLYVSWNNFNNWTFSLSAV